MWRQLLQMTLKYGTEAKARKISEISCGYWSDVNWRMVQRIQSTLSASTDSQLNASILCANATNKASWLNPGVQGTQQSCPGNKAGYPAWKGHSEKFERAPLLSWHYHAMFGVPPSAVWFHLVALQVAIEVNAWWYKNMSFNLSRVTVTNLHDIFTSVYKPCLYMWPVHNLNLWA